MQIKKRFKRVVTVVSLGAIGICGISAIHDGQLRSEKGSSAMKIRQDYHYQEPLNASYLTKLK